MAATPDRTAAGGRVNAARGDGRTERGGGSPERRAGFRLTRARPAELRGPPAWLPSPAVRAASRAGLQAGIWAVRAVPWLGPGWGGGARRPRTFNLLHLAPGSCQ